MKFQEGYVYHINDEYFAKVQDGNLCRTKKMVHIAQLSFV